MMILQGAASTSSDEYRSLAPMPPWPRSKSELVEFPEQLRLYFNDHFAFRKSLIRLQALVKVKWLGESATPAVVIGKDGWLFYYEQSLFQSRSEEPFTSEQLARWRQALQTRHDWLAKRGIRYLFVIAPEKQSIYPEYVPNNKRNTHQTFRFDQLVTYLKENSNVEIIDLRPPLLAAKQSRRVYFQTDTHWNTLGGFVAYQTIARELAKGFPEMKILEESDCVTSRTVRSHSDLARMVGLDGAFSEEVEDLQLRNPGFVLQTESYRNSIMMVANNREGHLPRLLAFCDSFSSALSAFLSQDFSRSVYRLQIYFDPGQVELEQPQVVMQEIVERYLTDYPPSDLLPVSK